LEELQTALAVVEKLRDYRPIKHTRGGSRAAIFSGLSPFTEKTAFDWGNESDVEEANGLWFGKGKQKGKGKHKKRGNVSVSNYASPVSESSDPYQSMKPSTTNSPIRSPGTSAALGSNDSSSPHRYPPSRSNSPDPDATLTQAAKAIKSTLLHDARNIKGKDENLGALVWNVSSTAEAKVWNIAHQVLGYLLLFSVLLVLSSCVSRIVGGATWSLLTFTPHTKEIKMPLKLHSVSLTRITTVTSPDRKSKTLLSRCTKSEGSSRARCVMFPSL
jgi:hypothetical protein